MPKSKHRKNHSQKLADYKANKKKEQEVFKKKMIDQYIKMQQEMLERQEAHSSVEEVAGPEINVEELNTVDLNLDETVDLNLNELETINIDDSVIESSETK